MSKLIERLRMGTQVPEFELRQEAADEIERLRAELAEVQECERDLLERDIKADDEIKRLRAELRLRKHEYVERQEWAAEQAMAVIKEKDTYIERLRTALERIANAYKHDSIAGDIAREALEDG